MKLLNIQVGETVRCRKRGCLRYLKNDTVKVADIIKGWVVPEGEPNVRIALAQDFWRKA